MGGTAPRTAIGTGSPVGGTGGTPSPFRGWDRYPLVPSDCGVRTRYAIIGAYAVERAGARSEPTAPGFFRLVRS